MLVRTSLAELIKLRLLPEALFNVRSTRESTRDPGAKKASLATFCKGGSPAAGGGSAGGESGSPETGAGGRGGESEGSSPAAGVD